MEQLFDCSLEPLDFDFVGDLMGPFASHPLPVDLRKYSLGPALQLQEGQVFSQPEQASTQHLHLHDSGLGGSSSAHGVSMSDATQPETRNHTAADGRQDASNEKHRSYRERNQAAQRKYRLKNKEHLQSLERQAHELARELDRVQEEKRLLEMQTRAMEVLLDEEAMGAQGPLPLEKEADPPFVPSEGIASFNPMKKTGLILKVLFQPPRRLTHDQVLYLSLDDHRRIFREVSFRAAKLLLANPQEDPNSPPGKELQALYSEKHGIASYAMVWNPTLMHRLQSMSWSDSPRPRGPDHWRNVQRRLRFTYDQKLHLARALLAYRAETAKLLAERQRLQAELQRLDDGSSSSSVVRWSSLTQALQMNVDSEHIHFLQMFALFRYGKHGLTIFQEARLYVESYPDVPDISSIIQSIVEELESEGHHAHKREQVTSLRALSLDEMLAEPFVPVGQRVLDMLRAKAAA